MQTLISANINEFTVHAIWHRKLKRYVTVHAIEQTEYYFMTSYINNACSAWVRNNMHRIRQNVNHILRTLYHNLTILTGWYKLGKGMKYIRDLRDLIGVLLDFLSHKTKVIGLCLIAIVADIIDWFPVLFPCRGWGIGTSQLIRLT